VQRSALKILRPQALSWRLPKGLILVAAVLATSMQLVDGSVVNVALLVLRYVLEDRADRRRLSAHQEQ
jgi:hypothetical protein